MPVMKRVKCPPLTKITGERPGCQNCHKPLTPRTWWLELVGHLSQPPSAGELVVRVEPDSGYPGIAAAIRGGYEAERVYRIEHLVNWKDEPQTKLSFWCGTYDGRGWRGDGMPPLFCSQSCGLSFGVACWHADMRISEKKPSASE